MSDTILGVIIGGAIGVIPSIVIVFVEFFKQRQQQKFELYMERMRIYEVAKKEALQSYMQQLGAMNASSPSHEFKPATYFAAAKLACMYVSDETADAIEAANVCVEKCWSRATTTVLESEEIRRLNGIISHELHTPILQAYNSACKRDKKSKKRDC